MKKIGIELNVHYIPVYLHPFYQKIGFKKKYCPEFKEKRFQKEEFFFLGIFKQALQFNAYKKYVTENLYFF